MKKGIKQGWILLLIIFTLVFTSCTNQIEQPNEENQELELEEKQDMTPVQGGTLSFSILKPTHFNPILDQEEENYHMLKLIFEPLLSLDKNYKIEASLAEDWTIEEGGNRIVFDLRNDVYWHDNEPFTAEDVKFTLDVLKSKDVISPYQSYVKNIGSYQIINDSTIEITFLKGKSVNLESFVFPILPAHRYKNIKDIMKEKDRIPIGTGPYRFEEYQKNKKITFKANEKYWGHTPYIETVLVEIRNNREEVVRSFEVKDVDLLKAVDRDWNRFKEDSYLNIFPYATQKYSFIGLNHQNKLFQDVNIRKAIQMAINREEMLERFYLNQGKVTDIPLSPDSWLYDKKQSVYSYQPEEARKLLKENGWKDTNNNKILDKELGEEKTELIFDLMVNRDNQLRVQEASKIKKDLGEIGIGVNIIQLPMEKIEEKMVKKDFEAIQAGWNLSFIPDLSFAFHSNEVEEGMNFISYKSKKIDKLLENANKSHTDEERLSAYSKLQSVIREELPYIHLYFSNSALIINDRIKGPTEPTDYNIFNNIEEWFIEYE